MGGLGGSRTGTRGALGHIHHRHREGQVAPVIIQMITKAEFIDIVAVGIRWPVMARRFGETDDQPRRVAVGARDREFVGVRAFKKPACVEVFGSERGLLFGVDICVDFEGEKSSFAFLDASPDVIAFTKVTGCIEGLPRVLACYFGIYRFGLPVRKVADRDRHFLRRDKMDGIYNVFLRVFHNPGGEVDFIPVVFSHIFRCFVVGCVPENKIGVALPLLLEFHISDIRPGDGIGDMCGLGPLAIGDGGRSAIGGYLDIRHG